MQLQLVKALLWLLSLLPLRWNHALGAALGWCVWRLPTPMRRSTLINLSLCFPAKTAAERTRLARCSLVETGKALTELGWIWCRPPQALAALVRDIRGQEHLQAARQQGRGLIIISPHLGSWEFCTVPLTQQKRVLFTYRTPRQPLLEPLVIAARTRFGAELAPLHASGIRKVIRGLRDSRALGILPDQEPERSGGVFAPFFGVDANTMTLLSRLSAPAGVGVVMMYCERLSAGGGYRVHYLPADKQVSNRDKTIAATALNASLESCIKQCPEQYLWSYKRFRLRPDGTRRNYRSHST